MEYIKKKLIERTFPVDVISRDAAIEMSFKPSPSYFARCRELSIIPKKRRFFDPKIRSLLPWLARRPRSVARAVNLASLLPENTSTDEYLRMLGFSSEQLQKIVDLGYPPLISYTQPALECFSVENVTIMDPMAGGGSIPLEAVILGAKTIACDYNPVAFLILKATLEWPIQFGKELYYRVCEEAKQIITFAKDELGKFYGKNDRGYIIVRQIVSEKGNMPLVSSINITKNFILSLDEEGKIKPLLQRIDSKVKRELLSLWVEQHKMLLNGDSSLILTHKIVAVQEQKGFRVAKDTDQNRLKDALEEFLNLSSVLPDLALSKDNSIYRKIINLENYRFLFNPRQALVLAKLLQYLRERTKVLLREDEEFGVAIATYLAFGLCRIADFNSILTSWNYHQKTVRDTLGAYYKFREFRLEGVYAEAVVPYRTIEWVFEPYAEETTTGGICPVLKMLTEQLQRCRKDNIQVFMADVLNLGHYFEKSIDIINVDPPYFDVHKYGDFSEFFWPILQTALEDALPILFNRYVLFEWSPKEKVVPRRHEVIGWSTDSEEEFENRLTLALLEMRKILKDDGLLILWFYHKEIKAWKAVARALQKSGFVIVNIIPIVSEHPTRSITNGGKGGTNRVLILINRKIEAVSEIDGQAIQKNFIEQLQKARLFHTDQVSKDEEDFFFKIVKFLLNSV